MASQLLLNTAVPRRIATAAVIVVAVTSATAACVPERPAAHFRDIPIPAVSPLDAAAERALVSGLQDQYWAATGALFPELTRPTVEVVGAVLPEEWGRAVAQCMADGGFSGTATADGGFETGAIEPAIAPSYYLALYVCEASHPVDPRFSRGLDRAQLRYLYAYYRDVLAPCLSEHGYQPDALPSDQSFADTYASERWSPYDGVRPASAEEWADLQRACPQFPERLLG